MQHLSSFEEFKKLLESQKSHNSTFGKSIGSLYENASSNAEEVVDTLDEIDFNDLSPEEQAEYLDKLIDANGNMEKVDIDSIKEKSYYHIHNNYLVTESIESAIHITEIIGNIIGNIGLVDAICGVLEKKFGLRMDNSKIIKTINKFLKGLKAASELVAKSVANVLVWILKKLGIQSTKAEHITAQMGMAITVIFFATLGFMHFPVLGASSVLWIIASVTGLMGKGVELIQIGKHIMHIIKSDENSLQPHEFDLFHEFHELFHEDENGPTEHATA